MSFRTTQARRLAERRIRPEAREAVIARLTESAGRPIEDIRAELDRRAVR